MPNSADLIRTWFEEVWNKGRESAIDEMCAKDAVGHGQTHDGTDIIGLESFKHFWRAFRAGFSDIHVTFHQTIAECDLAMLQWTIRMKHTGPFVGIPATGKTITAKGMSIQRFKDGKIVEAWDTYDQLAIMVQLGAVSLENLVPAPKPAEARIA
jgi:steroid delta-isomerase-like uncharacterized protein